MKVVLLEAALVATLGVVLAFAANALSPRGLRLSHNFFPAPARDAVAPVRTALVPRLARGTNATELLAAQLKQQGLQIIESQAAARLFADPNYDLGLIAFIDARDEQHYEAGHIPGAYPFDHYHAEKYFATVLPVCQQAQQVIVYCNGGDCEDSQFAAVILRDAGVEKQKLYVYAGGISEWKANGSPLELGARKSGNLVK